MEWSVRCDNNSPERPINVRQWNMPRIHFDENYDFLVTAVQISF